MLVGVEDVYVPRDIPDCAVGDPADEEEAPGDEEESGVMGATCTSLEPGRTSVAEAAEAAAEAAAALSFIISASSSDSRASSWISGIEEEEGAAAALEMPLGLLVACDAGGPRTLRCMPGVHEHWAS